MGWYMRDVEAAAAKIRAACPEVAIEHFDYGFGIEGYKLDAEGFCIPESVRVILQPARPTNNQPEIVADIDELIRFWKGN